jgi:molybdopterin converting factor small subunit
MKTITVRLSGAPAALAQTKKVILILDDAAAYSEVIRRLGEQFPALIGMVIDHDGQTMLSSNMFVVNGKDFIMHGMWSHQPQDGDTLTLVSPVTGG